MKRVIVWNVSAGGHQFAVETRDKYDWTSDTGSDTIRVGAIAEVMWRDSLVLGSALKTREATAAMIETTEDREITHKRAIELLAIYNGFTRNEGDSIVAAFEFEKIGESD